MESKTGSVLSLIGGILWLVLSIILIVTALIVVIVSSTSESMSGLVFGIVFMAIGIVCIVYGVLAVKAAQWMKEQKTSKRGGIVALIIGILGMNILVIIGGILGLIDSDK